MKRKMMVLVLSLVLVTAFGISASQAKAEESKWKIISYISNWQQIPVGDEEGHVLAVYERRGSVMFEDGEMAAVLMVGANDRRKDGGQTSAGYYQFTFKEGSTIWAKFQASGKTPPGEKLPFIENNGEFVNGTGRFEGIKGNFACKGPIITPYTADKTKGDFVLDCSGNRTLPHK